MFLFRALVTGGAGFIGSHLVGRLISEGFEVYVLDNFFTGSLENIRNYLGCPRLHVVKGDVRRSCANINKAREILGFRAKTPLEVGLEKGAKEYLSN